MPKATLEFNLCIGEDSEASDFELAVNARKLALVISEMRQLLRTKLKHGQLDEKTYEVVEEIQSSLLESISDINVLSDW
jgi:hypothetical protein